MSWLYTPSVPTMHCHWGRGKKSFRRSRIGNGSDEKVRCWNEPDWQNFSGGTNTNHPTHKKKRAPPKNTKQSSSQYLLRSNAPGRQGVSFPPPLTAIAENIKYLCKSCCFMIYIDYIYIPCVRRARACFPTYLSYLCPSFLLVARDRKTRSMKKVCTLFSHTDRLPTQIEPCHSFVSFSFFFLNFFPLPHSLPFFSSKRDEGVAREHWAFVVHSCGHMFEHRLFVNPSAFVASFWRRWDEQSVLCVFSFLLRLTMSSNARAIKREKKVFKTRRNEGK